MQYRRRVWATRRAHRRPSGSVFAHCFDTDFGFFAAAFFFMADLILLSSCCRCFFIRFILSSSAVVSAISLSRRAACVRFLMSREI